MESPTEPRQDASFIPGSIATVRLFGVPVRLHFTFVLLFVFLLVAGIGEGQSGLMNAVYITALFGSIVLHELAHALVGRHYGVRTLEIVMFPIGGVTRLQQPPKPRQEFWIAVAGPTVNVAIAAGLFGALVWRGGLLPLEALTRPTDANLFERIATGNLVLAAFNLLPAFPMDGGRILRSVLALRRPPEQATRLAARAGQFLAIGLGLYGLLAANYLLVFIAFFVYLGAAQESAAAVGRILTQGTPVRAAMVTDFRTLSHADTVRDAANLLLAASQQDFPVMHGDQVIGLLGRAALLRAMASSGPDSYVAGAMNREFVHVSPEQDLAETIPLLSQAGSCVLVMDGDRLVGLLTSENLSQFLLLRRFGMPPETEGRRPA
ncbi:MAG: site-2 protease family protein [Bryobacteraceae bacterium]|jgi:Zn-dependent protease